MRSYLVLVLALLASSCAVTGSQSTSYQSGAGAPTPRNHVQGILGATHLSISDIDVDSNLGNVQDSESTEIPLIGGVFQYALGGQRRIHVGLEGGFTLGWQGNIEAFATGSNGAAVVAENDVRLTDIFGGVYGDIDLGEKVRLYAGIGPTLQFGQIDLEWQDPVLGHVSLNESGFGTGYYTRVGVEFLIRPDMAIGAGFRYVDSGIDFGGDIDSMDLEQEQWLVTFTQSY